MGKSGISFDIKPRTVITNILVNLSKAALTRIVCRRNSDKAYMLWSQSWIYYPVDSKPPMKYVQKEVMFILQVSDIIQVGTL